MPVPLLRVVKLLERRAQDVFHDHETRIRRDHEPLRADRAVSGVARALVEHRNGRHELSNQTQRNIDVEAKPTLLRVDQHVREPNAIGMVGHDCQRCLAVGEPLDRADTTEGRMTEIREAADAFTERELERRNRRQLVAEAKQLDRLVSGRLDDLTPLAKTVHECARRGRREWERSSFHVSLKMKGRET